MAVFHTIFVALLVVFFVESSCGHLHDSEEDDGNSGESLVGSHKSHIKAGGFIKKIGFKGGKGKFGTAFISKKGFSSGHFRDAEQTPSENPPQDSQSPPEVNQEQQLSPAADVGSAQLWQMPYNMHRITDPREMRYGWVYQVDHNEPAVGSSYQLQGTPQHLLFRDMENTISGLEQNTMNMNQLPLDQTTNFRKVETDNPPHPESPSKPDAITSEIRQMQNPSPSMSIDSMTVNQPTQFRLDMPQSAPPADTSKPAQPLKQDMSRSTSEQDDSKPSNPMNKDFELEQNPTKQLVDVRQATEEHRALDNTEAWTRSQVFQACNPGSALRHMTQQEQMPQQLIFQQQMPAIEHLRQMTNMQQQQMPMPSQQISGLQQQPSIEQRQSVFQQQQQMPMPNQQVPSFEQQQPTFEHRQMAMTNQQMPGLEQQQQQQPSFEHRQMTVPNQQMSMISPQMPSIQQQQQVTEHRQMPMPNQQMPNIAQQPGVEQRFMVPQQQMQTFEQQMPQQQHQIEGRMEGSEATKPDQVKLDEMHAAMEAYPDARHFHHKKKGHHQNIFINVPSYGQHYGGYGHEAYIPYYGKQHYGGYSGGYGHEGHGHGGYGHGGYGHGGYGHGGYGHGEYGHAAYSGYVGAANPQEPSSDPSSQPETAPPAETATNSRK